MRKKKLTKVMAFVLSFCLCFGMAMPTTAYARGSRGNNRNNNVSSSKNHGNGSQSKKNNSGSSNAELTLLEDDSTVEKGTALRAATYATTSGSADDQIKYFDVTMFDYDTTAINNATHQLEVDQALKSTSGISGLTKWNGLYFNDGNPAAESYTYSTGEEQYTYTLINNVNTYNYTNYINKSYVKSNGEYYLVTDITYNSRNRKWTVTYEGGTLSKSSINNTLYTRTATNTATTASLSYADYNFWTGKLTGDNGNRTYSGLVKNTLDANKNIQFADGIASTGIFSTTASAGKTVYTNVGLPFRYNSSTQMYTFDSNSFSAYGSVKDNSANELSTDGVQSGKHMYYSTTLQSNGGSYGDGSTNVWMPFNNATSINGEANCNYHFGMTASIPFTMTEDGKMLSDKNKDITFSFSGDDDVWVFVDGTLVLDIGGIHNRLDGEINFGQNTWTLSKSNNATNAFGDVNNADSSGRLFNDDNGTGVLGKTLSTFAATEQHELTVYYLERGAGSSNCKIEFNLPQYDNLTVTKKVAEKDNAGAALSADTLESINNMNFGFTLYKDGEPVANTKYTLLSATGESLATYSTDSKGHFTLKNGQSARFKGDIRAEGYSYYVVEDTLDTKAWTDPTFSYTAACANGASETEAASGYQSMTIEAKGSNEAKDTLSFMVSNTVKHVDKASITANDDRIVIDYGLPVEIDVLANDVAQNATKSIEKVEGNKYGTVEKKDGKLLYTLTEPLSAVEVLTYTVKATATNTGDDDKEATAKVYIIPATTMYYEENFSDMITYSGSATWNKVGTEDKDYQEPGVVGTVDDSPYGSDRAYLNDSGDSNGTSNYVSTESAGAKFTYTFTGTGTAIYARTSANSGYLKITIKDQAGNELHSQLRDTRYLATEDTNVGDQLYNIPIYTYETNNYGTYTVIVQVAKKSSAGKYGTELFVDGIRVMNPLGTAENNAGEDYQTAVSAYAADGEANMTYVTLRNKLLSTAIDGEDDTLIWPEDGNFVLFTDSNGKVQTAEEYKNDGPKNEVYLYKGQSVSFSLDDWDTNTNDIYLGMKAPAGNATATINGHEITINNTSDCYYAIKNYADIKTVLDEEGQSHKVATFTITAGDNCLVSVTNIKVTGDAEFVIVPDKDEDVDGSQEDQTEESGGTTEEGGDLS